MWTKQQASEYQKKYYKAYQERNREKINAYVKVRARKISKKKRDEATCVICGKSLISTPVRTIYCNDCIILYDVF